MRNIVKVVFRHFLIWTCNDNFSKLPNPQVKITQKFNRNFLQILFEGTFYSYRIFQHESHLLGFSHALYFFTQFPLPKFSGNRIETGLRVSAVNAAIRVASLQQILNCKKAVYIILQRSFLHKYTLLNDLHLDTWKCVQNSLPFMQPLDSYENSFKQFRSQVCNEFFCSRMHINDLCCWVGLNHYFASCKIVRSSFYHRQR